MNIKVNFIIACTDRGIPEQAQLENLALPTCHVQKWWKTSAAGRSFWGYKGGNNELCS